MDPFWLTDEQFARIAPHLPNDTRGKERVDDRRVISGIVPMLKSGGRWTEAPRDVYRPKKTLYNRFVRWAAKGVWAGLFEPLAQAGGAPSQVLIDLTAAKARRCAAGGKEGGTEPSHRPLARRAHDPDPRPDRSLLPPARLPADRWAGCRLQGRRAAARTSAHLPHRARRQRLRHRRHPPADRGGRGRTQHPAQDQPTLKPCFSPVLYRGRNAIERMFGRLKDFRRMDCDRSVPGGPPSNCDRSTAQVRRT